MQHLYFEDDSNLAIKVCTTSLQAGHTAVIPAGTVYGLVAHSESASAYSMLFKLKRRAKSKPIALLCSQTHPVLKNILALLTAHGMPTQGFLAGQVTVVFDANHMDCLPAYIQAIQPGKVGVRYPANSPAAAIVDAIGGLAWGTSANFSDEPPCSTVKDVKAWLAKVNPGPKLAVFSREQQTGQASKILLLGS